MDLIAAAERWIADDPDPDTRAELRALLDRGDEAALAERFGARLEFGTAGIRGPLGAGPARMNRVVVRQVTAGLAAHLLATEPGARRRGVVVGFDARHKSPDFAADAAGVLAAAGIPVHLAERPVPTPLLAFAVRHLDTVAGVQITASHNPAPDNGYKVYWSGGGQIVPPQDAEISAAIDAVEGPPPLAVPGDGGITALDPGVLPAYVTAVLADVVGGPSPEPRDLRIVYTPMHGVGRDLTRGVLEAAGFRDVHVVTEQAVPDPDFPTVPFPNPEEPGALDLALDLARRVDADVVLANDPDADRIAVAVPAGGDWRVLSGDEVGCVLGEARLAARPGPASVVGTTVVSSTLLGRIAAHHGAAFVQTLTGFKWLAQATAAHEAEGRTMQLAYEQALGVMVGTVVRDKDGISAALAVADLAARCRAAGRGLAAAVDDLARRHGLHLTRGRSVRLSGADWRDVVDAALARLRARGAAPLAGTPVVAVVDHLAGTRTPAGGPPSALSTPPTDLIGLELEGGARLMVRPSGTEPLLKCYIEVVEPVAGGDVDAARARAGARADAPADAPATELGVA